MGGLQFEWPNDRLEFDDGPEPSGDYEFPIPADPRAYLTAVAIIKHVSETLVESPQIARDSEERNRLTAYAVAGLESLVASFGGRDKRVDNFQIIEASTPQLDEVLAYLEADDGDGESEEDSSRLTTAMTALLTSPYDSKEFSAGARYLHDFALELEGEYRSWEKNFKGPLEEMKKSSAEHRDKPAM